MKEKLIGLLLGNAFVVLFNLEVIKLPFKKLYNAAFSTVWTEL